MSNVMKQRRVLLMYATMTRNTEKVAGWFKDTFEYYGWDVTYLRITNNMNWAELQDQLYFDDYDLICLGSPIVGGQPLQCIIKSFSFGAGGGLEKEVQDKLDTNQKDAAAGASKTKGAQWRRRRGPAPGMPLHGDYRPYGIVFSTYGGGFYGSEECIATLEMLKLYLGLQNVDVIGTFCCGGKETGPAGYALGVKPKADFRPGRRNEGADADVCDAVQYTLGDGTQVPGSYFFHYDLENKPGPREEAKAKAFIADVVEDYFMTFDGERNPFISKIISIS